MTSLPIVLFTFFLGYDVIVASDAVGMGLNLNIKRVIFSTVEKFDGHTFRTLDVAEIKQIAGITKKGRRKKERDLS